MANRMIIQIDGDEEQVLQVSIPDTEPFTSNGLPDDHNHQYAVTEDLASLLGNPSSESLTLYKSEPMEQDEVVETEVPVASEMMNCLDVTVIKVEPTKTSPEATNSEFESSSTSSSSSDESASDDENESSNDDQPKCTTEPRRPKSKNGRKSSKAERNKNKTLESIVQDNVESYLKQKGYSAETPITVSKGMLARTICPERGRSNTIAYSVPVVANEIQEELARFWKFYANLKKHEAQLAEELGHCMIPILVQMFLIIDLPNFGKLYPDFSKRIWEEDKSEDTLLVLSYLNRVVTSRAILPCDYLKTLQTTEYHFVFSNSLFQRLHQFLIQSPSPIFTYVFTVAFVIMLKENEEKKEEMLEDELNPASEEPEPINTNLEITWSSIPGVKVPKAENEPNRIPTIPIIVFDSVKVVKSIQPEKNSVGEAIYHLRNSVEANIPSIHLYTLSGRPISAAISCQGSLFAFGMSTSAIHVCFATTKELERFNVETKLLKTSVKSGSSDMHRKRNSGGLLNGDCASVTIESDTETATMINTMFGHIGPVYDFKFHPKSRCLFSVGHDATLRAWDLRTFQCKYVYRGHFSPIWCMDITDTGHMIVTGSMDTTARIWLPEKLESVRLLVGHYFDVNCVKFHPNEAYVATGSADSSVRMWCVADGSLLRLFTGAAGGVSAIAFHESGKYIIGGGEDAFIRIWDIAKGESLAQLPSPVGSVSSCRRIGLCQNMLAATFGDNTVRIWNLRELFGGNDRAVVHESESCESDTEEDTDSNNSPEVNLNCEIENDSDSDTSEYTTDNLEPIQGGASPAVRLPAPKIIPCDSSSILALYYQDFRHLFVLGSKIETSQVQNTAAVQSTPQAQNVPTTDPQGVTYLPDSVRPTLISAGITRWPIPMVSVSSSDEEGPV